MLVLDPILSSQMSNNILGTLKKGKPCTLKTPKTTRLKRTNASRWGRGGPAGSPGKALQPSTSTGGGATRAGPALWGRSAATSVRNSDCGCCARALNVLSLKVHRGQRQNWVEMAGVCRNHMTMSHYASVIISMSRLKIQNTPPEPLTSSRKSAHWSRSPTSSFCRVALWCCSCRVTPEATAEDGRNEARPERP